LIKIAADEAKNFATEKVIGEIWLSIMNLVRNTSGVDKVNSGCTRECSTVGRKRSGEQTYEGRARSVVRVLRWPFVEGVMINLSQMSAALRE